MYLDKQVKSYIYVVIGTMIFLLLLFLLLQNIATPVYNNNLGQTPAQQIVAEQAQNTTPVADSSAPAQNNADLSPPVVEQPAAQGNETAVVLETTEPAAENNNKPSVAGIAVIAVVVLLVGGGIYFLLPVIRNRFKNDENDALETIEKLQDDIEDVDIYQQTLNGHEYNEAPEDESDINFDCSFDYSGFDIEEQDEGEGESVPGSEAADASSGADELELCREIERLTIKANTFSEHIEKLAAAQGVAAPPEIICIEEYDELPADASALQEEIKRLKNKTNLQIDYIEEIEKKQADNVKNPDNNNNKEPFLVCVANALSNMQRNEQVYKPTRQRGNQDITYVPSTEFFSALSTAFPDYKKKKAVEALIQHGIINDTNYDTVYNKTRVLKINSKQFELLTTEITHDVGA